MALYEQRIFSYEAMHSFDQVVDNDPSAENIAGLIVNDIENKQCFEELKHYNDKAQFLFIHPLTKELQEVDRLRAMRKNNPELFASELVNCNLSITRYKSQIKNKKYKSPQELGDWLSLLKDYEIKRKLLNQIISE